jgi:hypothetical protein
MRGDRFDQAVGLPLPREADQLGWVLFAESSLAGASLRPLMCRCRLAFPEKASR